MDRYGRIDPDERARRPVTPPWRAECGDYVCPLEPEEDDMWDLEGAGSQLMGSPVMHR